MLYALLYAGDYDEAQVPTLLEGPDGLSLQAIRDALYQEFDHRGLGPLTIPDYTGPMEVYRTPAEAAISGNFSSLFNVGRLTRPIDGPEYKAWIQECQRLRTDWDQRRENKLKEWRERYGCPPNADLSDLFVAVLKQDHGLKPVPFEFIYA